MNPSNEERAALRKLLQARLNGKVTGFQDAHLNAMLQQGLSTEGRLAIASWSELSALLPRVLVHTLLAAYNSSALNGPGVCSTCFANFAKVALALSSTDYSWSCFITCVRLRNVHSCLLADLQAHPRSKRMGSSPVHVCMVRSLNSVHYRDVGDDNSVHIRLDDFCCSIIF